MYLPESIEILRLNDEEEILDKLNELNPEELLELQAVADKITEFNLIVILAREEYGLRQNNGTDSEV